MSWLDRNIWTTAVWWWVVRGLAIIADEARRPAVEGEVALLMNPIGIWPPAPSFYRHAVSPLSSSVLIREVSHRVRVWFMSS